MLRNILRLHRRSAKALRLTSFRPRIEPLEDRFAPATLTVTSIKDSGFGTLRYEVGLAKTGDTINFSTTLNNLSITLASQIQLGLNNVTNLTIDAGAVTVTVSGNSATRIFEVTAGSHTINDLTLSLGLVNGTNGGAILVDKGATLNLSNDDFSNNKAPDNNGGAIENDGTLTVNTSTFTTNSADNNGGAISSNSSGGGGSGTLTVNNTSFFGGSAINGAGISTSDNTTLDGDTFGGPLAGQPNVASFLGGGIYGWGGTKGSTRLTVTNSVFTNNKANGTYGGAIATYLVTDIETSTFTNNIAATYGGAIYYIISNLNDPATPYDSSLQVNEDTFTSNSSASGGGAISSAANVNSGTITVSVTNSTFYQNTVTGLNAIAGGLNIRQTTSGTGSASANMINDTFFKNSGATHGGGLAMTLTNTGTGTNNAALTSLTINQNTASTDSGGLYIAAAANGVVSIRNSILDGNTVTAQGYNGPIDVTLTNNLALNDIGYNLVGTSDTMFGPKNKDILNNTTGLASALAGNGAKAGYPQTLALTATKGNTSPGYETGDPGLAGQPDPLGKDERGLTRQAGKVSIGAEDPDAM